MQQENLPITIKQKNTIIKNMFRVKTIHDDYHKLDRAGHVILIRLRTGHNRLNAHMYKKMKLVASSMCICNIEDQTTEHILQRCPNHTNNIRNQLWPDNTTLQQKRYGTLEELRRTVSFIQQSGFQCNLANKKKNITYHRPPIQLHTDIYIQSYIQLYTSKGCLPREWCLCWSGGTDAWQGCSEVIGLSDPSTITRRRGRSTPTTTTR